MQEVAAESQNSDMVESAEGSLQKHHLRKLLPAAKPLGGNVSALSQDELFGQGFKVPELDR